MTTISTSELNTPTTTITTSTLAPTFTVTKASSITATTDMPWHSPIPYLFGGIAAMLGLIAFALLMLACSYRRLSGQLQNQDGGHRDLEKEGDLEEKEDVKVYEEKILVIMAGDDKPTFLATPVCPKSLSSGDVVGNDLDKNLGNREDCYKPEKEMDNNHAVVRGTTSPQENQRSQGTQQEQQSQ